MDLFLLESKSNLFNEDGLSLVKPSNGQIEDYSFDKSQNKENNRNDGEKSFTKRLKIH